MADLPSYLSLFFLEEERNTQKGARSSWYNKDKLPPLFRGQ